MRNSQRYTLMAEDAVESAGAKAPAITISTRQFTAGEGGLMSNERCAAVHPTLGIRCDRKAHDCWGTDHTATVGDGRGEFWSSARGNTPMHIYFRIWMAAKKIVTEEIEKKDM